MNPFMHNITFANLMSVYCRNCMWPGQAPQRARKCILSEDCALSEWSEWRSPARCSLAPFPAPPRAPLPAERTRTVLALPQGAGKPCGPLQEINGTEWSDPAAPAELVRWAPGNWGPCRVHREPSLSGNSPSIHELIANVAV